MSEEEKNEELEAHEFLEGEILDKVEVPHSTIVDVKLSEEMRNSFLDYSMSVIVSRAIPDVRDGLKPVHRRILYGMSDLGITPDKPHKKSARIVGDVMGKYHPHGDSAIYEAMVRMAQPFSYRAMLVDGHGNFGSMDGDGAAAMRYTEARMSKIALELVRDLKKNTVDFTGNYDETEVEPTVLPARFPNLLVNGTMGIAVGMATNIPPHNLGEVIAATQLMLHNPDVSLPELMQVLPGPDFPTGAIISGRSGIRKAFETGRGSIILRAKCEVEVRKGGRERIIVTEVPYMVNKARLIERIAELNHDGKIEGITELRDESNREGVRVVIGVHKDTTASVLLNHLYKNTALQSSFGINMLAIDKGVPKTLGLREILTLYIAHQNEVIVRRTEFDKKKAEEQAHILAGLRIALDNIDRIIKLIRESATDEEAKQSLITEFDLSDKQAQAILDMRLRRLTGLQRDKIEADYQALMELIKDLEDILARPERVKQIIDEELEDIKVRWGDDRRTEIQDGAAISLEDEDLIEEEDVVITLSSKGYIKRIPKSEFKVQNRGGRGVKGMTTYEDDYVSNMISTSTHDYLLFITNRGVAFRLKGYEIPEYSKTAKGLPIVNLLPLDASNDEHIQAIIQIPRDISNQVHAASEEEDGKYSLVFVTRDGLIKKTNAEAYSNIRKNGLRAIKLREDDEIVNVILAQPDDTVIVASKRGYSVRFALNGIRNMGRISSGVKAIRLQGADDAVIGAAVLREGEQVLIITEKGFGKRTIAQRKGDYDVYPVKGRGGKGVKTVNITEKNGDLVSLSVINATEDVMIMTNHGVLIRVRSESIRETGRVSQGVRIKRLDEDEAIVAVSIVEPEPDAVYDESEIDTTAVVEEIEELETEIDEEIIEE